MARSFPASAPFCSPCSQAAEPNSKPRVAGRGFGEGQAAMRISAAAFPGWISDVADVAQIVGLVLAILAALWARKQLRSATVSAESQAVLALDQAFSLFEDLRKELNSGSSLGSADKEKLVTLRRYVAVFERLGLLLKKGVVGVQLADQLYGSRLSQLLNKSSGQVNKIVAEREGRGWENFIELWRTMRKKAPHRKLPDPDAHPAS
jgi:hypothetical protein